MELATPLWLRNGATPDARRHSIVSVAWLASRLQPIRLPDAAIVRNGTAGVLSPGHHDCMRQKNAETESGNATRASVQTEMAKPRMARSARIAELNLDTARSPEQPSASMAGTVDKIIPSPRPSQPEQAEIAVDGAAHRYRDLRIDNTFTDEHGDDVKLKKGDHVNLTVTAAPKTSTAIIKDDR